MHRSNLIGGVLALPRAAKRLIVMATDATNCVVSVLVAYYLRLGEWTSAWAEPWIPILASIVLAIPLMISFGLYRAIFRYSGGAAFLAVAKVCAIYGLAFSMVFTFIGVAGVPRTVGLIQPLVLFLLIGGSRAVAGSILGETYQGIWQRRESPRVLIYGAGSAGRQLASAIRSGTEMVLVGFVDDDAALARSSMNGVPIHPPAAIPGLVDRHGVTDILLAIPSASRTRRGHILQQLKDTGLHVRTLPGLMDIASGKVSVADLKELDIEDLLGRAAVPPVAGLLSQNIEAKTVLVTGAGGSIGSELCRQIAAIGPATLILVDHSEFLLYSIHQELLPLAATRKDQGFALVPLLASVTDSVRMNEILSTWTPDSIFHAAAYKHVPLVEHNPIEGVRNNVIGTWVTARAARDHGVGSFVLVSTDKAVRPTNVMGTSKRLAEMILQAMQTEGSRTCFSMVRFGNVLGSSGSVVPLFRRQIAAGGPVTITHPEVIRYFMTIAEAAQLVLQAGAMANGGEVFVLDMGEPVRILDLARNMIELSGFTVRDGANINGDVAIETIGLRPGEKLFEELLIGENAEPTPHPRILRANESFMPLERLGGYLATLIAALDAGDAGGVRALLREVVPEYRPTAELFDFVSQARSAAS